MIIIILLYFPQRGFQRREQAADVLRRSFIKLSQN